MSAPKHFPDRWRLSRAGIVNVWHYVENEFDLSGGRMILRGTNGAGKSRALELLLPFLLDADRRKMDATGHGKVKLDELMDTGGGDYTNRDGYLWLELAGAGEWLTIGALIRHSRSSRRTKVWYFVTPLRVGHEVRLLDETRQALSREALGQLVGADYVTESADTHRERVRSRVFGLDGAAGRDRFDGLRQLLHTLRSPDIGNRIDEGHLPRIVSDALPPLDEQTIAKAGERLDDLTTTRQAQQRLEQSLVHVETLLGVYRRYAAATLLDTAAATSAAADAVDDARREADARAARLAEVTDDLGRAQATAARLSGEVTELEIAVQSIKSRDIFRSADDLAQRVHRVDTLATGADRAIAEAGREHENHAATVRQADSRLDELRGGVNAATAALASARRAVVDAGQPDTGLPSEITLTVRRADAAQLVVRVARDGDPTPIADPTPARATLLPADADAAATTVDLVADAATQRRDLAQLRHNEAVRLERDRTAVLALEADADRSERQASADEDEAQRRADERDGQAAKLATAWRAWVASPATSALLVGTRWADEPLVGAVLDDVAALADTDTALDLSALDGAAERQARPARAAIAAERAELDIAARADDETRTALDREAAALRREEDPAPHEAPWLAEDRPGLPLWRAVDFTDELPDADRAGVEGALLAAGLLSAVIESNASLRAEDGTLLISPGQAAETPLSRALRPDPSGPLPAELVTAVLNGIGLGDDTATTSVSADGSWHHGSLRGRHAPSVAEHIGAAARAAKRERRLAAIDAALAALATRARQRRGELTTLAERERQLDEHLATAPRSTDLHTARRLAAAALARAERSRSTAREVAELARAARDRWAAEFETHRRACEHYAFPTGVDALADLVTATDTARAGAAALASGLREIGMRAGRHAEALADVDARATRRDEAYARADEAWREWLDLAAEVAALREAIGLDVAAAERELRESERAHKGVKAAAARANAEVADLGQRIGEARTEAQHAASLVEQQRTELTRAAGSFNEVSALPGLLAAVTDKRTPLIERPDDVADVRAAVANLNAAVPRPAQRADASAVLRAFQTFDREVSGQLDADHTLSPGGVALITVVGAGDDHTLAGAGAELRKAVERGRAALTEREREVFTTFVLGGVAEELRRRINQARDLVAAMNASLGSIRTSNGIGVKLSWRLIDEAPQLRRIVNLVATADAVRSTADSDELVDLLRSRVEEYYANDPSGGYATHLAAALDYRLWHDVDVTILGPGPNQQRRISRRAKLSQGETRFVSYVTLFAAADGYLSGLSPTGRQLRLILLDDAFAKVDDPTISELMGLLVHLDLDFVMTGHALWGCYPTVPRLDIYEVRRADGTSAVTTHVHWDGKNRHLRSTA